VKAVPKAGAAAPELIKFDARLDPTGPKGAWCFLAAPFDVEKVFGTRARVPISGTINGFAFRSSLMPMRGKHVLCINRLMQQGARVKPGDTAHFVLQRDNKPRTVTVPALLKRALASEPKAKAVFDRLAFTHQKEFVEWVAAAKQPETTARRIDKTIAALLEKAVAKKTGRSKA
jgi:hypothetical protein